MSSPSLGIAIPSYEQPRYVGAAIRALRELGIPFEAIIRDAGSSDTTLALINESVKGDSRFTLTVEPDGGQSDAINKAWEVLVERHRYLTWLNTDDVVYPTGIAMLIAHLERHPETVASYGDLDVIDEDGRQVGWTRAPNRVRRYRLVYHHNLVPGIVPIIRSTALLGSGMMDVNLTYAMDHDLFVRLAALGPLRRVPVEAAAYRVYDDSKTWRAKAAMEEEIGRVRERYRRLPGPAAGAVRTVLRAAWWPTRRRYTRGVMRLSNRDFGVRGSIA